MPPDVDNKALARQKRRRTSKEDEDILKAEYFQNPKPDKAARLRIVRQVALGEKEVQIWFQNKRQNDRRRSRPLEPSSTASLMSSSSTMSDPPTEEETRVRDPSSAPGHQEPEDPADCPPSDPPQRPLTPDPTSEEIVPDLHADDATKSIATDSVPEKTRDPQTAEADVADVSNSQHVAPSSQNASQARTSWISNRRSASFIRYNEDYAPEMISFPNAPPKPVESPELPSSVTRSLNRTHSYVRLSTNGDGTAHIVTDLDKTPSPPHIKTTPTPFSRPAAGLRRSYSAAGFNERLVAAARGEPSPKIARTSSNIGRSRDSRAWEFWCDPDSRSTTSLTTRAEQEGSGSAADAIGILRANRKILAQNHARQNTPLRSRSNQILGSLGSPGVKKARGLMQRASTTHGRFATKSYKKREDSTTASDDVLETTSDKENWDPDTPTSLRRDRQVAATPPASRTARQILGENTEALFQESSSLSAMLLPRENRMAKTKINSHNIRKKKNNRESPTMTLDPEDDEELRRFMAGGQSTRTSLSSAEEAGCVEGLLKLSQAQWK